MSFECIPAIDLRGGRVVRLFQGDFARQTDYPDDPLELARSYSAQGARWLHLVDLDGARDGGFSQAALVARIRRETTLQVQAGGGIRSASDVATLLAAGAARVVVGTLAVREPALLREWLRRFGPDALCIALDVRADAQGRWRLPVSGWTLPAARMLDDVLAEYAQCGLRHLLCTDIGRDGTLAGPNVALYARIAQQYPHLHLVASGGVGSLEDVASLRRTGACATVLGRALLDGRFTFAQARTC